MSQVQSLARLGWFLTAGTAAQQCAVLLVLVRLRHLDSAPGFGVQGSRLRLTTSAGHASGCSPCSCDVAVHATDARNAGSANQWLTAGQADLGAASCDRLDVTCC